VTGLWQCLVERMREIDRLQALRSRREGARKRTPSLLTGVARLWQCLVERMREIDTIDHRGEREHRDVEGSMGAEPTAP